MAAPSQAGSAIPESATACPLQRLWDQRGSHHAQRYAEHALDLAQVHLGWTCADTFIRINGVPGDLGNQHMAWQRIHPSKLPQHGNKGFGRAHPFGIEQIAEGRRQLVFVKQHDRQGRHLTRPLHHMWRRTHDVACCHARLNITATADRLRPHLVGRSVAHGIMCLAFLQHNLHRTRKGLHRDQKWPRKFGQLDKWKPCFKISVARPNTGAKA